MPVTKGNIIDASRKKKKQDQRDLSHITCYNCDKKGHYAKKLPRTFKKLVLVLATSLLVTGVSKVATLVCVPYISYPVQFRKDDNKVQALLDSGSKVNAINAAYAENLSLWIPEINVGIKKIDGSSLHSFEIVIANFQVQDKLRRARFF